MLNVSRQYDGLDADSQMLVEYFDEPLPSSVLEVGCNEEYVGNILTENGYQVVGIDLRKWGMGQPCIFDRREEDFCEAELPKFNSIVSLSAIEHFGLGTYREENQPYYDVVAMARMRNLLLPGGTCWITVPYGKEHRDHGRDWRVYNKKTLAERIIQNFIVDKRFYFTSGGAVIGGQARNAKETVTEEEADEYDATSHPHVTVFLKLRK